MAVYFYMSDSTDGWRNLATDRFFLENLKNDDIMLYFYVNAKAVIIGRNQNAWRECNIATMEKDGVQLVRRHTGGGAVFHDDQNLNFSFIMNEAQYDVRRQMGVIQKAVAALGMTAELSGRNDILIEGKKFSGNAFAASKGMRAHHGTILVNTDLSKLAGYLNVSEKKMQAKGVTSVKSRVCNLSDFNSRVTVQSVMELLKKEYQAEYGTCSEYKLNEQELAGIEELYAVQASWQWRFGRTPAFNYQLEERFSFGEMQFLLQVEDGLIADVSVFTDALDTGLVQLVKSRMTGIRFQPQDIAQALKKAPVRAEFEEIAQYLGVTIF